MTLNEMIEECFTRDEIGLWIATDHNIKDFAKLVAAAEREACNAICEDAYDWARKKLNETTNAKEDSHWAGRVRQAQDIGHAIRTRGEQ